MKQYMPPAITDEDLVEQTSLACNASAPVESQYQGNFAPGLDCWIDVSKNGAFICDMECTVSVPSPEDVFVLS